MEALECGSEDALPGSAKLAYNIICMFCFMADHTNNYVNLKLCNFLEVKFCSSSHNSMHAIVKLTEPYY